MVMVTVDFGLGAVGGKEKGAQMGLVQGFGLKRRTRRGPREIAVANTLQKENVFGPMQGCGSHAGGGQRWGMQSAESAAENDGEAACPRGKMNRWLASGLGMWSS